MPKCLRENYYHGTQEKVVCQQKCSRCWRVHAFGNNNNNNSNSNNYKHNNDETTAITTMLATTTYQTFNKHIKPQNEVIARPPNKSFAL